MFKGCVFESRHHILDRHFFTFICCKNSNFVCLKRPKINLIMSPHLVLKVQLYYIQHCNRVRGTSKLENMSLAVALEFKK